MFDKPDKYVNSLNSSRPLKKDSIKILTFSNHLNPKLKKPFWFKESSKTIPTESTTSSQAQASQSTSPKGVVSSPESLASHVTATGPHSENKPTAQSHLSQNKVPHNSILNRFKQQFEIVVSLKNSEKQVAAGTAKNEANNTESQANLPVQKSPSSPTSDLTDQSDENQKTMTKKDGIALLEQCRRLNSKSKGNKTPEKSPESLKTPTDIASKLNDLYFKHLEEENKEKKLESNESDLEIDEKLSTDDEINSVLFQLPQNTADLNGASKNTFMAKSNTQICLNKHSNIYNNKSSSLCSSPVVVSNLNRSSSGVASVGGSNRNMGAFKTIDHLGSITF